MIYYDGENWQLCTHLATFLDNGHEKEKYTYRPERYENLAEKHKDITDMTIKEVEFEKTHKKRLEQINKVTPGGRFSSIVEEYVKTGSEDPDNLPEGYKNPYGQLKLFLEQLAQNKDIADAFYELMKVVE